VSTEDTASPRPTPAVGRSQLDDWGPAVPDHPLLAAAPDASRCDGGTRRFCAWCGGPVRVGARRDAVCCSTRMSAPCCAAEISASRSTTSVSAPSGRCGPCCSTLPATSNQYGALGARSSNSVQFRSSSRSCPAGRARLAAAGASDSAVIGVLPLPLASRRPDRPGSRQPLTGAAQRRAVGSPRPAVGPPRPAVGSAHTSQCRTLCIKPGVRQVVGPLWCGRPAGYLAYRPMPAMQ
jgi:hypothetical protein